MRDIAARAVSLLRAHSAVPLSPAPESASVRDLDDRWKCSPGRTALHARAAGVGLEGIDVQWYGLLSHVALLVGDIG
jgi:hypothetical protein